MLTRRNLLKSSAATGLSLATGALAAPAIAQGAKIRLGYVSPQSGPLAAFAEADQFILDGFAATEAGQNFEVIVKDSQSNPNRAADVARELIIDDQFAGDIGSTVRVRLAVLYDDFEIGTGL